MIITPRSAAIGYAFMAFLCFVFGALVGFAQVEAVIDNTPINILFFSIIWDALLSRESLFRVVFFLGVMGTFVFARQNTLEGDVSTYSKADWQVDKRRSLMTCFVIIGFATFFWILAPIWNISSQPQHSEGNSFINEAVGNLFAVLIIALPAVVWTFVTYSLLGDEDEDVVDAVFQFPHRVYFPALFCTTSSFLLGWWTATDDRAIINSALILEALLCVLYLIEYRKARLKRAMSTLYVNVFVFGSLFFAPPLLAVLPPKDDVWLLALTFTLLCSFAISVAEVGSRIFTHSQNKLHEVKKEDWSFYQSQANYSTLILVPFVPVLSLINPVIPAWFLAVYSALHLWWWIRTKDHATSRASWAAVRSGFILVAWVMLATYLGYAGSIPLLLVNEGDVGDGYTLVSVVVLFASAMLAHDTQKFGHVFSGGHAFKDKKAALLLFMGVAVLFLIYTSLLSSMSDRIAGLPPPRVDLLEPLVPPEENSMLIRARIWEMQQIMLLLVVVATVAYVLTHGFTNDGDSSEPPDDSIGGNMKPNGGNGDFEQPRPYEGSERLSSNGTVAMRLVRATFAGVELGRPLISSVAGASHGAILYLGAEFPLGLSLVASLMLTLVTMFGFVVNDVWDYSKDQEAERLDKGLVNGMFSLREARAAASILLLAIISICVVWFNSGTLVAIIFLLSALVYYSTFSRRLPLFKGIYTAGLCLSPLILAEVISDSHLVERSLYAFGVLFFVGRELFLDVLDVDFDQRSGTKTLAVLLGGDLALRTAWILMIGAYVLAAVGESRLVVATCASSVACLAALWWLAKKDIVRAANLTTFHLVFGVAVVVNSIA